MGVWLPEVSSSLVSASGSLIELTFVSLLVPNYAILWLLSTPILPLRSVGRLLHQVGLASSSWSESVTLFGAADGSWRCIKTIYRPISTWKTRRLAFQIRLNRRLLRNLSDSRLYFRQVLLGILLQQLAVLLFHELDDLDAHYDFALAESVGEELLDC